MSALALRVKTKTGQLLLKTLTSENTMKDLKEELSNLSNIPVSKLHVLFGFPPKVLDVSEDQLVLSESGLTSGDTLILEEKAETELTAPIVKNNTNTTVGSETFNMSVSDTDSRVVTPGILMKQVVAADNSCLFNSVYYVLNGKLDETGSTAPWLRQIIAETVASEPENFNEAILGKPNPEYCVWIQDDKSWGGAIELAILSNYFGMEIAVVDTINAIINRFGEDQQYAHRVFLLFDGIHYDPLYLEPYDGSKIQTIFSAEDESLLEQARELAKEANISRQFTDVNKFTLKCMLCDIQLSGQVQAQQHAQKTGHTNFGEIN